MDILERVNAERACERLIIEYCHLTDSHETDKLMELFAEHAQIVGSRDSFVGSEAIGRAFKNLHQVDRVVQHVVSGIAITVTAPGRAVGKCYFAKYEAFDVERPAPAEAPLYLGRYLDEFIVQEDQWKFSRREVIVDFDRRT